MKEKKRTLLHSVIDIIVRAGLELIIFLPLLLGLGVYMLEERVFYWLFLLPLQFILGSVVRKYMCIRRVWVLAAGILLSLLWAGAFIYFTAVSGIIIPFVFATAIFFYYRGVLSSERDSFTLIPNVLLFVALGLYLIGFFTYSRIVLLKPYLSMLGGACVIFIPVFFYRLNHRQLSEQAFLQDENKVPGILVSRNRLLVSIALLSVFLISLWKEFVNGITYIVGKVISLILLVILKLLSLMSMEQAESKGGGRPQLPFLPEKARSRHPIIEWILLMLRWLIVAAAAAILLYLLYKVLVKLIRKLAVIIRRWIQERDDWKASHFGYTDEKESIFNLEALKSKSLEKLRQIQNRIFNRDEKWEDCRNNRERIRFLYRQNVRKCIKKGYSYHPSYTPNETICDINQWGRDENNKGDELLDTYNKARYSKKHIEDSTVERILSKTD